MTKEVDFKIFSKVADLTVERVKQTEKLKNAKSSKSYEQNTETINRYQEKKKKMPYTHYKTWLCVKNSVREKNKRQEEQ